MTKLIELCAASLGTHYLGTLLQTLLHMQLAHRPRGGRFFRTHMTDHHAIYRRVFTTPTYLDETESLTAYYLVPIALGSLLAFWLLPRIFAVAVLGAFLLSLAAQAFVHVQYHLEGSVLNRFGWFRRRQELHRLHHEQPSRNFGVLDFFWDRLMGTFVNQPLARQAPQPSPQKQPVHPALQPSSSR